MQLVTHIPVVITETHNLLPNCAQMYSLSIEKVSINITGDNFTLWRSSTKYFCFHVWCHFTCLGSMWPCICFFGGRFFQDLFNIACSILVQFLSSVFSIRLVSIHVVHSYSKTETSAAWKKLRLILPDKFDFLLLDNLFIAVHTFSSRILMLFSGAEILLPRYVNLITSFRESPLA